MTLYAEVIIPKPLDGTFTYRVPEALAGDVRQGVRVIVPFGPRRYYTGIVESVSPVAPQGAMALKEISTVLDSEPVVRNPQLKFWHWLANYYLCPVGDVMKAALPAALKPESETVVQLSPDAPMAELDDLSAQERRVLECLNQGSSASVDQLERTSGVKGADGVVARLIDRGFVEVSERMVERYRAVKRTFIAPAFQRHDTIALNAAFDAVRRSERQQRALMAVLVATDYQQGDEVKAVDRALLVESTGLPVEVFKALESKGLCRAEVRQVSRFSFTGTASGVLPTLSEAQGEALRQVHHSMLEHDVTLLRGVTASGKTEVYIHLIDYVLRRGDQALLLVPEIALTTQLTGRLQRVFGDQVVIYHSKFSDSERVDIWRRMLTTQRQLVVIGARSAVFLPFARLGLVVVDEEHEPAYKQFDPAPRYNARDAAIVLASMHGAKTLLGSATPSVETYYKATTGKYGLVELLERYGGASLPTIEVIDMSARTSAGGNGALSRQMAGAVNRALDSGRQAIVFINRRGYSPFGRCKLCQFVPKCDFCDVSLTYHRNPEQMVCHYCGAVYPMPRVCPSCHEPAIEIVGYGTERVEQEIAETFAGARVLRMDLDTTRSKDAYARIIDDFSQHRADLLVGTQMVTKGLDFSDVSVVGIVSADALINYPDFRASERAFNMIEQVAGRAGRRDGNPGSVLIQTFKPEHPVITFGATHDYLGFYAHELDERRQFNYPPFTRVINIYLKHRDRQRLEQIAADYYTRLRTLLGSRASVPVEPPVARVQSMYIRRIMLKLELEASPSRVKEILRQLYIDVQSQPDNRGLRLYYDVDPW